MSGASPTAPASISIAMLREFDALSGLGDETLEGLIARGSLVELRAGDPLTRRGEPNASMSIVLSGGLRVDVGDRSAAPLARLGPGEIVGEMSLLGRSPASADVTAEQFTRLLVIDEAGFYWLIHASHAFAVTLLTRLAARLRSNNDAVEANIALRQQFEHAALHDALTGVHSRRWLNDSLPRIVQRHLFASEALSLAVLDVDHFKRINDTFGHPAGDAVLIALGKLLRDKVRPTDLVARMGGEEFVLILPHTPLWGAHKAAERLRRAIGATPILFAGKPLPQITVSLGVACLEHGSSAERLLDEADQALYRAKQLGRNQTQCFGSLEAATAAGAAAFAGLDPAAR